ncbi:unnamed protein product, partial [Rotaria sp. Silwood1]
MDIVVANTGTDNVGVFLLYDNGYFASQMTYPTGHGSAPRMVVVGDFNNDNQLDIAVANFGTNSIGILLGNGDGNFSNQTAIDTTSSRPLCLALGDFNNDKQLDIAIANYGTNSIGVYLGLGNASFTALKTMSTGFDSLSNVTFASQITYSSGTDYYPVGILLYPTGDDSHSYSIAVGDFNNDSRLDIAVTNSGTNNIGVLLGYSNGTFTSSMTYSTGIDSNPVAIALGDFNNDNQLDIAVANHGTENVAILIGYGNGSFSSPVTCSTGIDSGPKAIAIGDFNNDGRLDIVVANPGWHNVGAFLGYGNGTGADNLGIFFGYGDATFWSQTIYAAGDGSGPISIAVGDFNSDNRTDIAVANQKASTVGVFLAFINTSFEYNTACSTGSAAHPEAIAVSDLTNDGEIDVVVGNHGTHSIDVLFRYENGSFSTKTVYSEDLTFYPACIVLSDFNNDSHLDIAIANSVGDDIYLLFGEENETFVNYTTYSTGMGSNPQSITIGDFNNDYRPDIVVANSGTGSVGVLLSGDSVDFESVRAFSTRSGSKPHGLAVGDFNNDGRLDITVANNGDANIGFFFGVGDGNFSNQSTVSLDEGIYPQEVDVGDFNNDNQLDVVVTTNMLPAPIIVLLGNGNGSFQIKMTSGAPRADVVRVGDFNSDGRLDIIVNNLYNKAVSVLLGDGNGSFGNILIYPNSDNSDTHGLAVGDFNNDGWLDFSVAYSDAHSIAVCFGYGDGSFSNQRTYLTDIDSNPFALAVADFNDDGQLDIVVANKKTSNVGIFLG